MRIVLIEPSHWHFEMYRPGIVRAGAVVVGVIDRNPDIAARLAGDFGCQAWGNLASMLDSVKPDFAFAFGAHDQMPSIARSLIRRGVPFSMEKPGGIHSSDVRQLLKNARDAALYVSILRQLYPVRPVEAALVWTDGPRLMPVPDTLLEAALSR